MRTRPLRTALLGVLLLPCGMSAPATAGELTVELKGPGAGGVSFVGAVRRFGDDGSPLVPVDPKAKIGAPRVDALARREGGLWAFGDLPAGRYGLVILAGDRVRVEGFEYPPVLEFDPFLPPDAGPPEEEARDLILKDIAASKHYENKVTPLFLAGDAKQVRVLMQLVRDKPTSFDGEFGAPVATVRHEVWQYLNRYGGWAKERKTVVLDRLLMARAEFHRWTWVWEPRLGGLVVGARPVAVSYALPDRFDPRTARGWFPD